MTARGFASRLIRRVKFFFALLLTLLLVFFAVVNRELVDISLFPLPYTLELPKFLLAIVSFAAGAVVGGLIVSLKHGPIRRHYKKQHKRVEALENELGTLHHERHAHTLTHTD